MGKREHRLNRHEWATGSTDTGTGISVRSLLRMKVVGQRPFSAIGIQAAGVLVCLLFCTGIVWGLQEPAGQRSEVTQQEKKEAENSRPSAETPASTGTASAAVAGTKDEADPRAYIIGEQDGLVITVWKEKELSGGVVVRPDGKITVPLVGEIKVVGMTPVQVQSLLAEKLKPFVTVPQVTVAVTEIRSRKVYLIGHAAREGPFVINSSTTVLQIIAQAGGLKDFAKRKKIYILRQHGKEQIRFAFNYDDAIKGKNAEQNILLEPGDTIVVP
jgi:polysaccharide biosynthesis/export protein